MSNKKLDGEIYNYRVKERWPLKNGNSIVKLENDSYAGDYDIAKSINQMPCHVCCFILGHTKRLFNIVIREIYGCTVKTFTTKILIALTTIKKFWATLVEKG